MADVNSVVAVESRGVFATNNCAVAALADDAQTELPGTGFFHRLSIVPLTPSSALKAGTSNFSINPGKGRSSDAALPGPSVLIRHKEQP